MKVYKFTMPADITIGDAKNIVFPVLVPSRSSLPIEHMNLMSEENHIYNDAYTLAALYKQLKVGRCSLTA